MAIIWGAEGDVVGDAVGIFYMINPVMARNALAGLICGGMTLPQYISYTHISVSQYETY